MPEVIQRRCFDCEVDISERYKRAKRCESCAKNRKRKNHNIATKKHRSKSRQQAIENGHTQYALTPMTNTQKNALQLMSAQMKSPCAIPGCFEVVAKVTLGLCNTHNERWKRGIRGDRLADPIRRHHATKAKCRSTVCDNLVSPHTEHGLCAGHRRRQKKGLDINTPLMVSRPLPDHCEYPECAKPISGSSRMCAAHIARKRKGQDMNSPIPALHRYHGAKCAHPPCDSQAVDIGYCRFHGKRARNGVDLFKKQVHHYDAEGCKWVYPNGVRCAARCASYGLCSMHDWRKEKGLDMDAPKRHAKRPPGTTRTNTDGYQQTKSSNLKWVPTHRLVYEKHIGRALEPGEEIHHINGEKADNRLENLELFSSSHPAGQRVIDKIKWAEDILKLYKPQRHLFEAVN